MAMVVLAAPIKQMTMDSHNTTQGFRYKHTTIKRAWLIYSEQVKLEQHLLRPAKEGEVTVFNKSQFHSIHARLPNKHFKEFLKDVGIVVKRQSDKDIIETPEFKRIERGKYELLLIKKQLIKQLNSKLFEKEVKWFKLVQSYSKSDFKIALFYKLNLPYTDCDLKFNWHGDYNGTFDIFTLATYTPFIDDATKFDYKQVLRLLDYYELNDEITTLPFIDFVTDTDEIKAVFVKC